MNLPLFHPHATQSHDGLKPGNRIKVLDECLRSRDAYLYKISASYP